MKTKTRARASIAALLAIQAVLGETFAGTPAAAAPARRWPLDAVVRHEAATVMRRYGVPGLAVAVTVAGEQRFYSYGVASRDTRQKVTGDTLFEIGSISKTFTATLATYAQAVGRLSLDEPPSTAFPQLRGSALDAVTLVNLGTHTAGGFPLQVPEGIDTTDQLMAYFEAWTPSSAPGTQRKYANPSAGLLGMVAARSLDMPFAAAMAQLFTRLGLHDTYIEVPAGENFRYAQGYDADDLPVRVTPAVLAEEAYGVKTSARDLIHFVDLQLDPSPAGEAVRRAIVDTHTGYFRLGAMTQDLMWEQYDCPVSLRTLIAGNSPAVVTDSHPVTPLDPPLPAQAAVLVDKTGSTDGFGAYVAFVPSKRLGVVVLANKSFPNEARVRLAYRILDDLAHRSAARDAGRP